MLGNNDAVAPFALRRFLFCGFSNFQNDFAELLALR